MESDNTKNLSHHFSDPSFWGIVIGNVISMALAITQGWDLTQIMWIYWSQSVVIGVMNVIRMMNLKEFSTKGLSQNGQPVPETQSAKRSVAVFFCFHYGIFHFVYAVFLWQDMPLNLLSLNEAIFMLLGASAFVGSHSFSLMHNTGADFKDKKPNLGTLLFYPYLRIIPMHLAIIFGSQVQFIGLMIFMGLKTLADAGTHVIEHAIFQRKM